MSKQERKAERALEQARDDHFQTACREADITGETDLTCEKAFEQSVSYGFCRYTSSLRIINRLLQERGLELAIMDEDFGSEMAFVIQEAS